MERLAQLKAEQRHHDTNELVESIRVHRNLAEYDALYDKLLAMRQSGQVPAEWFDAVAAECYYRYN